MRLLTPQPPSLPVVPPSREGGENTLISGPNSLVATFSPPSLEGGTTGREGGWGVRSLKLGTRGSALALWQAHWVADRLRQHDPECAVEIVVIKTTGDLRQDVALGAMAGKGVFVREIEAALGRGEIDLAVHSAKDLQSSDPDGLTIAAFGPREDPRDALVATRYGSLDSLPSGAVVATGAPRRVAQLRLHRPDLRFVEIRGNVDTRLAKLERGDADALVLACAGLIRLERAAVISERLPIEISLPQVGQAAVAVQCRRGDAGSGDPDARIAALVAAACDDAPTRAAVETERAFLARVGGGCSAPIAAYARIIEGEILLSAFLGAEDGTRYWRSERAAVDALTKISARQSLADAVYSDLIAQNADI